MLRAAEWTESLRDMITSIFETNMSLSDTRMNLVMKKLTSWAAIIAVPTADHRLLRPERALPRVRPRVGLLRQRVAIIVIALRAVRDVQAQGLAVAPSDRADRQARQGAGEAVAPRRAARRGTVAVVACRAAGPCRPGSAVDDLVQLRDGLGRAVLRCRPSG